MIFPTGCPRELVVPLRLSFQPHQLLQIEQRAVHIHGDCAA
ncbi:MAG: hypothetical protein VX257_05145 [Planctomycetota bacterium]|nr:hypothetical protein [Planctomycetota bacterium]